jgi:hypothetical protein
MEKEYNGVVEDPRSIEQQQLDYSYNDLARGDITLNWKEYNKDNLTNYEIQNQDGSSSCVAQAVAKILGMHEVKEGRPYKRLCPKFIYTRRENYPEGGMWLPNALSIACKHGACEETLMPCDDKGETFMNNKAEPEEVVENAAKYRGKYYFSIPINIDKIAEVLEQGYGVLLGFRFDYDEWDEVPHINPLSQKKVGHGVADATEYFLYEGKKSLGIDDSWGPYYGKGGKRIITEDFLMARCFYAGYITSLENFIFTQTLRLGSRGIQVKMLQQKLVIKDDGIFGPKTKEAVKNFQFGNGLVADGIVGPKTRAVLNSI